MNSRNEKDVKKIQLDSVCVSCGERDTVYDVKDENLEGFRNEVNRPVFKQCLGIACLTGGEVGV